MKRIDKIKNMTLDEMTELLYNSRCNLCIYISSHNNLPLCIGNYQCNDGIKQWLQAEVNNE